MKKALSVNSGLLMMAERTGLEPATLESPLFIRKGRNLLLTEVARDYLTEIRPSLQAIGRATAIASQKKNRETLTIAAPPSLTTK
ncbi:hypothetical protein PU634_12250 [Oceanimonas pelagia]|uniref:Uncharacterized protein n=1 Tax=Oceanimonas pelagia TaxID=3028314 RepID=A0AA50QB48_9GAMM|nr:hypothetical protein [Oceanimonas pelagia]WMC09877.1 hypothetical protein PU634_12250 [Oceanimonas pelagia]